MRLLFVSDPHGSTAVFRKALAQAEEHRVDMLVVGGDLQGKFLSPVVHDSGGVSWEDPVTGNRRRGPRASVREALERIASVGGYGLPVGPDEQSHLSDESYLGAALSRLAKERLESWVSELRTFAGRTGIVTMMNPGNDDDRELDAVLRASPEVLCCDGRIVEACGFQFAGIAEVPATPWNTPRELTEDRIRRRLEAIVAPARSSGAPLVLCAHSPPFASGLDTAPLLDGRLAPTVLGGIAQSMAVGSRAIREFLEAARDVSLSLHGHVHEAGGFARIGRTLCLNPGSEYGRGVLWYFVVEIGGREVKTFRRLVA